MMDPEIRVRVDRLLQSYSAYYDVEECDERDLVAKARFHSRGEKYLLTRSVNLWSVEDNEYVFIYAGDHLDPEGLEHAIQMSSETGMSMIKPSSEHRSSMITTILIYRTLDKCCTKSIKAYRERRDFGFMLIEWVIAIIALICVGILYTDGNMPDGTPTQIFAEGISSMLSSIGLQSYETTTYSLVILAVSAFALTSLDTATRLARFMLQEFFLEKDQKPSDLQGPKRIITHPVVATVVTVVLGMALATVGYEKVWGLFGAANQLLAVLALLAVCAWLGNIGKSNRMIYIPMMFMLAATVTSLLFTMGGRIGDLASGFDGVAAAQLVISALLFVLAVFLMVEGLRTLNAQRRARLSESA